MEQSQVVVGYDFSHSGHAALERAVNLASRATWHMLQIVCVIHPRSPFPALPADHVDLAYAERVRAAVADEVHHEVGPGMRDRVKFHVHARIGKKPAAEILAVAEEVGADLIIVGSKGVTGLERAIVGSTSERIVREAHCTVEVARPKTYSYVPLLEIVDKDERAEDRGSAC